MEKDSNQLRFDFQFRDKDLTQEEKVENKIYKRIIRSRKKNRFRIDDNIERVKEIVASFSPDEEVNIISNVLDIPNIIIAYKDDIEELYVATWALTTAGIAALEEICSSDLLKNSVILMDNTHSYKWVFQSGAYKILKDKIKMRFTTNHSKLLLIRMTDGTFLNVVGSMNMSNNPRYENCTLTKSKEDFDFYKEFIETVNYRQLKDGKESTAE